MAKLADILLTPSMTGHCLLRCIALLCAQLGLRPGHITTALYGAADCTAVKNLLLLVADQEVPGRPRGQHAANWRKLIP